MYGSTAAECPWPGRSTTCTRWRCARSGTSGANSPPCIAHPCSSTSGGPAPADSTCSVRAPRARWTFGHACGWRRCAAPRGGAIRVLGRPGDANVGPHACGWRRCAAPRGGAIRVLGRPGDANVGPHACGWRRCAAPRGGAIRVLGRPGDAHAATRAERGQQRVDVRLGVRGGQRYPQARGVRRHGRRPDRGHPHAVRRERPDSATAAALAPTTSGWIAVSDGSRRHGSVARAGAEPRDQRVQVAAPRGVVADQRERRARRLRDERRRCRRVDVRARRLHERLDDRRMRGDERARGAGRLAQRAHVDDALGRDAAVREAAAAVAQHAEAVRVVDDEPRVVRVRELEQARERRDVAVHAEHRVGRDDLAPRGRGREARRERVGVAVRVADELRARQQRAVVQARVVQPVAEHGVAAAGERRQDREVREIARRERQRARVRRRARRRRRARPPAPRAPPCGRTRDATRRRPRPSARRRRARRRRRPDGSRARGSRCSRTRGTCVRRPARAAPAAWRACGGSARARPRGARAARPRARQCAAWRGARRRLQDAGTPLARGPVTPAARAPAWRTARDRRRRRGCRSSAGGRRRRSSSRRPGSTAPAPARPARAGPRTAAPSPSAS